MNCETVANNMVGIVSGSLPEAQLADCREHIAGCSDCRSALVGAEALALLKNRETGDIPTGLLEKVFSRFDPASAKGHDGGRFWLGAVLGGAIAASLFAVALTLGWLVRPPSEEPGVAEFLVTLSEPRMMDVAIETDRPLQGATISVFLSGGIELDGYGDRRELTWTSDLKAGINRLSLPVLALDPAGGQMVVRVRHPHSEQVFVVQLKTKA